MGCGASKNDVIKSATSTGNEPTVKESSAGEVANGDTKANGNNTNSSNADHFDGSRKNSSSRDSINSSLISEGSTIAASEKFGNGSTGNSNGNNNDIGTALIDNSSGNNSRNLPELPPLKPARTSRVGFIDQGQQDNGNAMSADEGKPTLPIAFEVPAEEGDASLIKKHPPRRLRQLEERPPEATSITQEALEEKVAQANERRNQVLHQRVASARTKSARGGRIRRPVMDSELETNEALELEEGNSGE